jgi:hypothetical protein
VQGRSAIQTFLLQLIKSPAQPQEKKEAQNIGNKKISAQLRLLSSEDQMHYDEDQMHCDEDHLVRLLLSIY